MSPPKEMASSSTKLCDFDSSKVTTLSLGNSPNWLPPDWIVITRIKRSSTGKGTTYKVYQDTGTGMKFYSRREVLEYLQNPHRRSNKRTRAETTPGECPTWLPPDWIVEIKMTMSGKTAGTRYKVYVEESTGKKFYSQREVLDYVEASKTTSPGVENVESARSEDYPSWMPPGWRQRLKDMIREKIKAYLDSNTEIKLYSQKEVFDYLNNVSSSDIEKRKKAEPVPNIGDQTDKVTDTEREETKVTGLPPGWFKAIKYRDTRSGICKKTAYYVDPKDGYAFYSTKDALRYIDNGNITDCRLKPTLWNKISQNTPGNKFHSQPTGEESELKSEGKRVKGPLFTEENCENKAESNATKAHDTPIEKAGGAEKKKEKV